jgi:hypothetical protein
MEMSGQLHVPAALLPGKEPPVGGWIGPRAVPDTVMIKISSPRRKSNPTTSMVQLVAQRYTD